MLLILVPFILAFAVWYFTRNQDHIYQSETTIYTGIVSGYNLESTSNTNVDYMGTNMQFDQIVNYLGSRKVIEETAIRLLAQHLMLETYDDRYINKKNWEAIQLSVPKVVKNLIVKYNKSGEEREKVERIKNLEYRIQEIQDSLNHTKSGTKPSSNIGTAITDNQKQAKTDSIKKAPIYHIVGDGETMESIASRYNLTVSELMDINEMQTKEIQPGMKLLCKRILETGNTYHTVLPNEDLASIAVKYNTTTENLMDLNSLIDNKVSPGDNLLVEKYAESDDSDKTMSIVLTDPISKHIQDIILPQRINADDYEKTVTNLMNYYHKDNTNYVYELLNYSGPIYSIYAINANLTSNRIQNSDLVKVTYKSVDQGIAQNTLAILTEVFIRQYRDLRVNNTDKVVQYFMRKVAEAQARLNDQEGRLLRLNQNNKIINYYEQSKSIALEKDALEREIQNTLDQNSGAVAVIRNMESKLGNKDSIYLKGSKIIAKRNELSKYTEQLEVNKVAQGYDPYQSQKMKDLTTKIASLKDEISDYVHQLYMYGHTTEGVPIATILDNWLKNVITYEESRAALGVLRNRLKEFEKTYSIFAPLGAMTKRYERQISVAEQYYIEMQRGLNQAKLRQQNLEMSSNMKIIDDPSYPIEALASKRRLLILAAAILGFLLVAFIIILLEYFDDTIKTPDRAERLTGLKLASAFPRLIPNYRKADLNAITQRLTDLLLQNIKLKTSLMKAEERNKPLLLMFFSTNPETGKSTIANSLIDRLRATDERVLSINYRFDNEYSNLDDDYNYSYTYTIDNHFIEVESISELLGEKNLRQENYIYDYILLEMPSIVHNAYPISLMKQIDIPILFVNATDHWRKSDVKALENLILVTKNDPLVVLNNAELFALEDIIQDFSVLRTRKGGILRWLTAPFRMQIKFKDKR
jgi:succinoglycan biosynthesis transport protein ExoP